MIQLTPITLHQRKARKRSIPRKRVSLVLGPDRVDGVEYVVDEGGVGWAGRGTLEQMGLVGFGGVKCQASFSYCFGCWESDGGRRGGEEEGRDGEEG